MRSSIFKLLAFWAASIASLNVAHADAEQELAKKLDNPISNLISVPFQQNYDCSFGPKVAYRYSLILQPVVPLSLNDDWNLNVRTIVPVISQEAPAAGFD